MTEIAGPTSATSFVLTSGPSLFILAKEATTVDFEAGPLSSAMGQGGDCGLFSLREALQSIIR